MISVRLRSVDVQGVAHVSLPDLIDQCGGTIRVEPARVNADLLGRSIVLGMNDTRVYSSRDPFSLVHPLIRHRGEVLIAVDDLDALVSQGFGAKVRQAGETPVSLDTEDTEDASPLEAPSDTTVSAAPLTDATWRADIPAPTPLNARRPEDGAVRTITTVIVDPGHGGTDPGFVSAAGFAEKDLTLAVALALRDILKERTALKTYITRSDDATVSPEERCVVGRREQGDLLISIHAATAMSDSADGFGVYYAPRPVGVQALARVQRRRPGLPLTEVPGDYSSESLRAARAVETAVAAAVDGSKHWVREAPVRILRDAGMPGIMLEVGHLTNPAEAALLESRSQQEKIARGIAEGIAAMATGEAVPEEKP